MADRWAKICGDLVAMGRLPNETPYWYIGNYQMAAFNTAFLTSNLTSAATPVLQRLAPAAPGSAVAAPSAEVATQVVVVEEAAAAAGEFLDHSEPFGLYQTDFRPHFSDSETDSRGRSAAREALEDSEDRSVSGRRAPRPVFLKPARATRQRHRCGGCDSHQRVP
jgi:hypothetical protein